MTYPYVSRASSSYRVRIRRAPKRFDTGTILPLYHRNIYDMDMFNDIEHTGVLSWSTGCQCRLSYACEYMTVRDAPDLGFQQIFRVTLRTKGWQCWHR